jgi:hypothetical protein
VSGAFVWIPLSTFHQVRRALVVRVQFSVSGFMCRAAAAMASTGCAALLIGGFPLLVVLTDSDPLGGDAGVVFAAVLVARSPLLVPLYGLRPVLTRWLITKRTRIRPAVHRTLLLGSLVGLAAIAVAYPVGPRVLRVAFGSEFAVSGLLMSGLTGGAVLMMLLTITGISLVVVSHHAGSIRGWFFALGITGLTLALPIPSLESRVCTAMIVGPALGVCWHLLELRRAGDEDT